MRRLISALVACYPRSWRTRYRDEYLALLEDMEPRWSDVWNVLSEGLLARSKAMKAWQWIGASTMFGLLIIFVVVARTPGTYTSSSLIRITAPSGKSDEFSPQKYIREVAQNAFSRNATVESIKRYHLYDKELAEGHEEDAVEAFYKDVKVECESQSNCGTARVSYSTANRYVAQRVTRDLMGQLIDANIRRRTQQPNVTPATMEVLDLPSLPTDVDQRWNFQTPLRRAALVGFALGLAVAVAAQFGWSRLAKRA